MSSTVEIQSHRDAARVAAQNGAGAMDSSLPFVAELTSVRGPLSPEARAALRAHAGFSAAVRTSALGLLELHHGNRLLNLIVNDRGSFVVGMIALDLHFNRDAAGVGLTPGRLRQLCVQTGACSPTRASALLALMRLGEFVRAQPSAKDRRRRELVPTERLIAAQRERWRCQFESSAPLLSEARLALDELDRPQFVAAMVRQSCAYYYAGFRLLGEVPALRLFGERTGGIFVVLALMAAAERADASGRRFAAVSISELARRIGSSRTHVIKLLNDAAVEGLVERPETGGIILSPRLTDAAHDFFAIGLLFLAHCAGRVREAATQGQPLPGVGTVVPEVVATPSGVLAGKSAAR